MEYTKQVAISRIDTYEISLLRETLALHFSLLGIDKAFLTGKKVVIKPNLVMKKEPDSGATTHPALIAALISLLAEWGVAAPVIAESPGGAYSASRMAQFYRVCGIEDAVAGTSAVLNTDISEETLAFPEGKTVKSFSVIKPVMQADVLFDVCKLKTHSLTGMSGAVKNLFGTIPGIKKFEMHAAFPNSSDFESMLCDLCEAHCRRTQVIAVTDAIVGMEGNGPTGGTPVKIGALITSRNPFASDLAAEAILGFEGKIGTVWQARKRGLCPSSYQKLSYPLLSPKDIHIAGILPAQSRGSASVKALRFFSHGVWGKIFAPHPVINTKKCLGCGECKNACPAHTIEWEHRGQRPVAHIRRKNCIRCFCCQELCPHTAIDTKRNIIMKIITRR